MKPFKKALPSLDLSHKIIPEEICPQVKEALRFYPELKDTPIEFKFKKQIKKSTMQAQPRFSGFFKNRGDRKYIILITEKFHIEDDSFHIIDLEDKVMVGWLGHELGHVIDYKKRSALGMLVFGFKYLFSKMHIREVERTADTYAVRHGMGKYILATKNFILKHTGISPEYKARIKNLYLSPEEIMKMVNKMDDKALEKKVEREIKGQNQDKTQEGSRF